MDRNDTPPESGIAGGPWTPGSAPDSHDLTEQHLLQYLEWYDQPISIDRLATRLQITRDRLRALLEPLVERNAVSIVPGFDYVLVEAATSETDAIADGGGPPQEPENTLAVGMTLGELLTILKARRRRDAIRVLRTVRTDDALRGYVTVPELADAVITGQLDQDGLQVDTSVDSAAYSTNRKALYVSFQSQHVPCLAAAGLVEVRSHGRPATVRPQPELDDVATALDYLCTIAPETPSGNDD
ncbi:DUF7344 domain-containing protein [Haloarcula sp. CGMCC 1.6347]|uniref:DUF7344 domain-containing protein n=1 Tax=Haloarcula sp. CGMCC 1.6347 TaxID=3111455 RepID=UPI00300F6456